MTKKHSKHEICRASQSRRRHHHYGSLVLGRVPINIDVSAKNTSQTHTAAQSATNKPFVSSYHGSVCFINTSKNPSLFHKRHLDSAGPQVPHGDRHLPQPAVAPAQRRSGQLRRKVGHLVFHERDQRRHHNLSAYRICRRTRGWRRGKKGGEGVRHGAGGHRCIDT